MSELFDLGVQMMRDQAEAAENERRKLLPRVVAGRVQGPDFEDTHNMVRLDEPIYNRGKVVVLANDEQGVGPLERWMGQEPEEIDNDTWDRLRTDWQAGTGTWEDYVNRLMRAAIRRVLDAGKGEG